MMNAVTHSRRSRMMLLILTILIGASTRRVLSWETGHAPKPPLQTKMVGTLVAVEPLPSMDGEQCLLPSGAEALMATATTPAAVVALRQSSGSTAATPSAPPRPSEAIRSAVAKRQPINTIRDPRNSFAG